MSESRFPLEICCDNCGEVVILVWKDIPGETKLSNMLDWLDTPMRGDDPVNICPICRKMPYQRDVDVVPFLPWLSKVHWALEGSKEEVRQPVNGKSLAAIIGATGVAVGLIVYGLVIGIGLIDLFFG